MNDDIKALEAACDSLWSDIDDSARPSPESVGRRAISIMMKEKCTFAEACKRLVTKVGEVEALEAQARAARASLRG